LSQRKLSNLRPRQQSRLFLRPLRRLCSRLLRLLQLSQRKLSNLQSRQQSSLCRRPRPLLLNNL
jgi:hypothetical protein